MRARALSFALLGLMTAVGLGLVVFISHLGWPYILGGPIPGPSVEHRAVQSRVIASGPTVPIDGPSHDFGSKPAVAPPRPHVRVTRVASGLSGSRKVVAPSPPPSQGNQPSGNGAPGGPPSGQPPPAAPTPAASSPSSTVASVAGSPQGNGKGGGHAEGKGYSEGVSSSVSKPKAYYPVPHIPAVTARPPNPVAAGPGKDGPSPTSGETGNGHGNGHAYGHYGK